MTKPVISDDARKSFSVLCGLVRLDLYNLYVVVQHSYSFDTDYSDNTDLLF